MNIDWSKVTKDTYNELLEYKNEIYSNKCKLSVLLLELNSFDNVEFFKIKNDLENLIKEYNKINQILNEIVI